MQCEEQRLPYEEVAASPHSGFLASNDPQYFGGSFLTIQVVCVTSSGFANYVNFTNSHINPCTSGFLFLQHTRRIEFTGKARRNRGVQF